jgi:hypothetical protein
MTGYAGTPNAPGAVVVARGLDASVVPEGKESSEDFVVLAGAEELQLAGAPDIDQEPIAFAADMALPETLPLPLERVVLVTPG